MADDGLFVAILGTLIPSVFVGTLALRTGSKGSTSIMNCACLWIHKLIAVEMQSCLRSQKAVRRVSG
jgi:hypothetical protein